MSGIETGESFVTAETFDRLVSALNTTPEDLFVVNHLKEPTELVNEIKSALIIFEQEPQKLEFLYKIVQTLLKD